MMTRWDPLHERYFNCLAALSFDKAKELLDKDGSKMHSEFVQHFHLIVQYERSYHSFGFVVGPKSNLSAIKRDKSLCQCYSDLHMSLIEGQSASKQYTASQDDASDGNSIPQLNQGLIRFLSVRTSLMKLYEQISSAVKRNEHNVRLENFLDEITVISQMDLAPLNTPVLSAMRRLLKHEIDCLFLLIRFCAFICDYQYMNSISSLHHMHCVLKEWHDTIDNQQATNHRFSLSGTSALNFFKPPAKPALFTFYSKFHELLVAKFTLYFCESLLEYGGQEAKAQIAKTNPDFLARIVQFQRRSNAELIALVLLKTRLSQASDQKLEFEHTSTQSSTSIVEDKPFEIILGYPSKPNATEDITLQIINKIAINHEVLLTGDRTHYIVGGTNPSKTYFLQNVDPRVTLVLVFASHRQERDTTISNFLTEFIDLLRGSRQLIYFKNPSK